jgi:putative oxidoreductase
VTFRDKSTASGTIFIRIAVGLIFFTQGILKYTDPNMGVNRFTRIGFWHPAFTAHFVGTFEIVCGLLILLGFFIRVGAIPLLIIICTAIVTTKLPEFTQAGKGFWFMVSDARTDFAMLMCLLFLLVSASRRSALAADTLSESDAKER